LTPSRNKHKQKINGKTQKLANVCDIVRKALGKKYVKVDVSIRDSLKKNVSQRGRGSHRPHGTTAGLNKDFTAVPFKPLLINVYNGTTLK
jgi:uncharacterized protein (UPF0261 family)